MKKLIFRNQQPINELKGKIENALLLLNHAYTLFKEAPFYHKSHNLTDILNNLDPIIRAYKMKLIENKDLATMAPEGLQLSREKYADLIDVQEPEGLRPAIFNANQSLVQGIAPQYFEIRDDQVTINDDLFQKFVDKQSIYAGTQKEQIFLQKYNDLGKAMESFSKFLKSECDILFLPQALGTFHVGMWYDLDEKNHYKVKPHKFEMLAKRIKRK